MRILLLIGFLFTGFLLKAGPVPHSFVFRDSLSQDSVQKPKTHSPKKAALLSACCPGLGQIYNGKKNIWKVPVIYAGFGGLIYGFAWNEKNFKIYYNALHERYDNDPNTNNTYPLSLYSDDELVSQKNYYERYRDLCVIGMAAIYVLNILDAAVYAHLATFDVSDDLSLRFSPGIMYTAQRQVPVIGLHLSFR